MSVDVQHRPLTARVRERQWGTEHHCWYCGVVLGPGTYNVEHQVPRSRGGTDDPANLVPSCRTCNAEKATKTVDEYRSTLEREWHVPYEYQQRYFLAYVGACYLVAIGCDIDPLVPFQFAGEENHAPHGPRWLRWRQALRSAKQWKGWHVHVREMNR